MTTTATRQFTPKQARDTLPLVRKIVADILATGQRLKSFDPDTKVPAELAQVAALVAEIRALLAELEEIGCSFKDFNFEIGLVDFPAMIDGELVLLCWKSDEPTIEWYHGLEDGFKGRKRIPDALLEG